jgi:hypothetical protein
MASPQSSSQIKFLFLFYSTLKYLREIELQLPDVVEPYIFEVCNIYSSSHTHGIQEMDSVDNE